MDWSTIQELIKAELLLLIPFCWVVGMFIKNTEQVKDKLIPTILWITGIVFSFLYLHFMIAGDYTLPQTIIASVVNGTFIAGVAVFGSQQVKQLQRGVK